MIKGMDFNNLMAQAPQHLHNGFYKMGRVGLFALPVVVLIRVGCAIVVDQDETDNPNLSNVVNGNNIGDLSSTAWYGIIYVASCFLGAISLAAVAVVKGDATVTAQRFGKAACYTNATLMVLTFLAKAYSYKGGSGEKTRYVGR